MILVKELREVLDKCEIHNFKGYKIERVQEEVATKDAVKLISDASEDNYIEIYDFYLDCDVPEYAIVYFRYTAPTATKITNYLLENKDKWWKER